MQFDHSVGTVDLGNLAAVWNALDDAEAQMHSVNGQYARSKLVCNRRFDEATQTGQRTYILANSSITAARDSHRAFVKAMHYDGVRAQATWGLIRPSFESAFYAVWMLQPEDSRARLQRGLRIAWEQHRMHQLRLKLMREIAVDNDIPSNHPDLLKLARTKSEHEARYRDEANSVGLSEKQMTAKVVLTDEVGKLTLGDDMPRWTGTWLTLIWRELSGATHGDSMALTRISDTKYLMKIPGGWTVQLTINDDSFIAACQASAYLQLMAMQLYILRSTPR